MDICVFCASSENVRDEFRAAVRELGQLMAERGHGLVFGGFETGLMGEVARAVRAGGGHVAGVTSDDVSSFGTRAVFEADELYTAPDVSERIDKMSELADAFAVCPGSLGTLEELFVVLVQQKLGPRPRKPIALLNVCGCYDWFTALCDSLVSEGAMPKEDLDLFFLAETPAELLDRLEA